MARRRRRGRGGGDYCVFSRGASGRSSKACYKTRGKAAAAVRSSLSHGAAFVSTYIRGRALKRLKRRG